MLLLSASLVTLDDSSKLSKYFFKSGTQYMDKSVRSDDIGSLEFLD